MVDIAERHQQNYAKWFKTCLAPDDDSTVVALQPFIDTLKEHLRDLDRKGLSMEKKTSFKYKPMAGAP